MQQNKNNEMTVVTRSETRFQTAVSAGRLANSRPPRPAAPYVSPAEMMTRSTDHVTMDREGMGLCRSDCTNVTFRKRR